MDFIGTPWDRHDGSPGSHADLALRPNRSPTALMEAVVLVETCENDTIYYRTHVEITRIYNFILYCKMDCMYNFSIYIESSI